MSTPTDASYLDVTWRHDFAEDPVRMVSELDAARYETRKLEFFRDGIVGAASSSASFNGTELGSLPVPLPSVINADLAFDAKNIDAATFEALWTKYAP